MKPIRALSAVVLMLICMTLLACGTARSASPVRETIGPWTLTVEGLLVATELKAEQSAVQYSGEAVQSQIKETPNEGMAFVLVQLLIEKAEAGAAVFAWDRLSLQDENGNAYARMENDTFLQSYGYQRQKSTDLTLGKNEGYLCFELPEQEASGKLTLCYASDDAQYSIPLN